MNCELNNDMYCVFFPLPSSGEKATKWQTSEHQVDGLTTNGVLIMHTQGDFYAKDQVWGEGARKFQEFEKGLCRGATVQ